jgi:hypothetical protein
VVESDNGDLVAGVLTGMNGEALSEGDHFLIIEYGADTIVVRQPIGPQTPLSLSMPSGWSDTDTIWAAAYNPDDSLIEVEQCTASGSLVTFTCRRIYEGRHVAYYKIFRSSQPPQAQWVAFLNDHEGGYWILGNRSYYEIGLWALNGGIRYILDKTTGDTVCLGNQWDCLWEARFPSAPDRLKANPAQGIDEMGFFPDNIEMDWDEQNKTMTLHYIPHDGAQRMLPATVTIQISENPWFTMQLEMANKWGALMEEVSFPHNLLFSLEGNDRAYVPMGYPGLALESGFFTSGSDLRTRYPGECLADFIAVEQETGDLALYSTDTGIPYSAAMEFLPNTAGGVVRGNSMYAHYYTVQVADKGNWSSPPVQFCVSEGAVDAVGHYRANAGIESYLTVEEKLGTRFDEQFGAGNWDYFPLVPLMVHDKTMIYQYRDRSTDSKAICGFNALFGVSLGFWPIADDPEYSIESDWVGIAGTLQKQLFSTLAGKQMTAYEEPSDGVKRSIFGDITVVWNRHSSESYSQSGHSVGPGGFMIDGPAATGGVFTVFNGEAVAGDDQYIVVSRTDSTIAVYHPSGETTPLSVALPESWSDTSEIHAFAVFGSGNTSVERSVGENVVTLSLAQSIDSKAVKFYMITYRIDNITSVLNPIAFVPFAMFQNYPNPFRGATQFRYQVPSHLPVRLSIYNASGRLVKTLIDKRQKMGIYTVAWDGTDRNGSMVANGCYIYTILVGDNRKNMKLLLQR